MKIDDPLILRFENIPVLHQDDRPVVLAYMFSSPIKTHWGGLNGLGHDELLWSCWSLSFVMEVSKESLDVSEESCPANAAIKKGAVQRFGEKNGWMREKKKTTLRILEVLNFNPTPETN